MISLLPSMLALPLALQSAPVDAQTGADAPLKPESFEQLPITESTAPRCGVAFAVLQGLQKSGDPRGDEWPTMEGAGGQEFFIVAMARLIDAYELTRDDVMRLAQTEAARLQADGGAVLETMLPACLALLAETNQPEG